MAAAGPRVRMRVLVCLRWRPGPGVVSFLPRRRNSSAPQPQQQPPHRRHPGISSLNTLRLPEPLLQAAQLRLEEKPVSCLEDHVRELSNFLWSRKRAVEDVELRALARELAEKFRRTSSSEERSEGAMVQREPTPEGVRVDEEERLHHRVLAELRRTVPRWKPLSYNEQLSQVYLAARMDGGFAAVTRVLHEIKKRVPEFEPRTLLDFGSGTGTVTWASRRAWGPSLREFVCVESSPAMHQLADFLMRGGGQADTQHSAGVYFRHFLPVSPKVKFDLVVSAYSLSEQPTQADRRRILDTLWRKTDGFLVLIESGTRDGHQILMEARRWVLTAGEEPLGHVFAPCPHDLACPKLAGKIAQPCNFSQAYHPLPFSWSPGVKQELFSYVVLSRGARREGVEWPRLVRPVLCRPRHVHTHLCCPDGALRHAVVTARRSGRDLYRCARHCSWGDRLPVWDGSQDP